MDPDNISKALILLSGLALNETVGPRLVFFIPRLQFSDLDNVQELKNIITPERASLFYHIIQNARWTNFGDRFYRPLMRIVLEQWSKNNQYQDQRAIAVRYQEKLLGDNSKDNNEAFQTMAAFLQEIPGAFGNEPLQPVTIPLFAQLRVVLLPRTDQLLTLLGLNTIPKFMTTVGEMLKRTTWSGFETGFYFTFLPLIYAYWIENQALFSEEALVGSVWAMLFMNGVMAASLMEKRRDEPAFKEFSQVLIFTLMTLLAISYFGPLVEKEIIRASAPVMNKWIPPFGYLVTKVLQKIPEKYHVDPKFSIEMISVALFIGSYGSHVQDLIYSLFSLLETIVSREINMAIIGGAVMLRGASYSGLFGYILDLLTSRLNPTRKNRRQRNRQQQEEYVDGDMGFLRQLFQLPEFPDDVTKPVRNSVRKLLSFLIVLYACQKMTNGGVYSPGSGCEPMIVTKLVEIMEMNPRDFPGDQYEYLEKAFLNVQAYYEPTTQLPQVIAQNMAANPYCERVLERLYKTWPNHWESVIAMGGRGVDNDDPRPAILDLYAKIATYRRKKNVGIRGDPQGDAIKELQQMINEINAVLRQSGDIWTSLRRVITMYCILVFLTWPFNTYVGVSFLSLMEIDVRRRPVVRQIVRGYDAQPRRGGVNFESYLLSDMPSSPSTPTMLADVLKPPVVFNVSTIYRHGLVNRVPLPDDLTALRLIQNISSWEPTVAQILAPLHSLVVASYPDFWYRNGVMARVGGREIDTNFESLKHTDGIISSVLTKLLSFIETVTNQIKGFAEREIASNEKLAPVVLFGGGPFDFGNWDLYSQFLAVYTTSKSVLKDIIVPIVALIGLKPVIQMLLRRGISATWSYVWGNVAESVNNIQEGILPLLSESLKEGEARTWYINEREKERGQQHKWRMAVAFAEAVLFHEVVPLAIPFHTFKIEAEVPCTMIYLAIMAVFWSNLRRTCAEFDKSLASSVQTNRPLNPLPLAKGTATVTAATATTPPAAGVKGEMTPAQRAEQEQSRGELTQGLHKS
jgi:hypothetical protein